MAEVTTSMEPASVIRDVMEGRHCDQGIVMSRICDQGIVSSMITCCKPTGPACMALWH